MKFISPSFQVTICKRGFRKVERQEKKFSHPTAFSLDYINLPVEKNDPLNDSPEHNSCIKVNVIEIIFEFTVL